jgi:hypothetical protein
MKNFFKRSIIMLLVLIMALPVLPSNMIVSAASKTSLSLSKMTLVGAGATNTLKVKNVTTSKVKRMTWYSLNEKVAIVDAKTGFVTAVGKGATYIKCKITYKDGKVERPYSKVTVQIPATEIKINNAKDYAENNNRHVIMVGETYNFNVSLTPSKASDKTYWSIDNTDYATVSSNGTVTGKKPGMVRLEAKAALTDAASKTSTVNDIINIEVVAKTAKVTSTKLTDTNTLTITFSHAMKESLLIGGNKKLHDNVVITPKTDEKGINAQPLGTLTASLSADGKVLTVKSSNIFNGLYGVAISSNVQTTDGISLQSYYENIILYDKIKPSFTGFTTDETGLKVYINFSEPIDFTSLIVTDAKVLSATQAQPSTISIISEKLNYVISEDKKSLMIDLSLISVTDHDKMFSLNLSGIKDFAGNYPAQYPMTVLFKTDTTPKDQARVISLVRTGFSTVTATFTRPISLPGMIFLSNGESAHGIVDVKDNKKVNYTLSSSSALLTGPQVVSIGYFDSFNVKPSDTSAQVLTKHTIDFTVSKSVPNIKSYELVQVTENNVDAYMLKITYDKNVTPFYTTGSLLTRIDGTNGDINSNRILTYSAVVNDNVLTLILNSDQIAESGLYTITLPDMFVQDEYMNYSKETLIRVVRKGTVSSGLPAPKEIKQSATDANIVYVVFANKVDVASAQNIANYNIVGATIVSAEVTDNNTTGATVALKLLPNSVLSTTIYPIYITGVAGYHNTFSAMEPFNTWVSLRKNKEAKLVATTYGYPTTITLTFDEKITGTPSFEAINSEGVNIIASSFISDNTIIITLKTIPINNTMVRIKPTVYNNIKDMNGNPSTVLESYVIAKY